MTARLTPEEKILARQALGLGIAWNRSTRNKAFAVGSDQWRLWSEMEKAGLAEFVPGHVTLASHFRLTRAGADLALNPGDILDPAHFPPIGAH